MEMRKEVIALKGESYETRMKLKEFFLSINELYYIHTDAFSKGCALVPDVMYNVATIAQKNPCWYSGSDMEATISIENFLKKYGGKQLKQLTTQKEIFEALLNGKTIVSDDKMYVRMGASGNIQKSTSPDFCSLASKGVRMTEGSKWYEVERKLDWSKVPAGTKIESSLICMYGNERFAYYDEAKKIIVATYYHHNDESFGIAKFSECNVKIHRDTTIKDEWCTIE